MKIPKRIFSFWSDTCEIKRGGLSRKQLEGLGHKAKKAAAITAAQAATLEAIILRKPQKHRSDLPANRPMYIKDEAIGEMILQVLTALPHHKRALFLKSKYDSDQTLSSAEITELRKFIAVLEKKKT